MSGTWYAGLDLGKVRDSTALSILEPAGPRLVLTYLRTWKPERDDCADSLREVLRLVDRDRPDATHLGLDARGLGRTAAKVALEGELSRRADVYPILPSHSDRPHRQRPDRYVWAGKKAWSEPSSPPSSPTASASPEASAKLRPSCASWNGSGRCRRRAARAGHGATRRSEQRTTTTA
jgi:hypothetical protein